MPIQNYQKLPVTISAVQITDSTFDAEHPNPEHITGVMYDPVNRCAIVKTLEGEMRGDLGDWLIIGIKGEVYPCKPDIFDATYKLASNVLDRQPMRTDFMIDIETLGTGDDAVILSIGAIPFDPIAGRVCYDDAFYVTVAWDEKSQPGRKIDTSTLEWWLKQDPAIFNETRSGNMKLDQALAELAKWIGEWKNISGVWANGASFDLGILQHAYRQFNMQKPWGYKHELCMRTLRRLKHLNKPRGTNHHNALADAVWQAEWVVEAMASGFQLGNL